ncbi:hypothetical protein ACTZWW_02920 [Salinarimonas sp. NSM]|uniref:hypothetical protein n=1 Tax=Salinarimonas sp. NSM TaxID=3458003 RepID=UPI0040365470
MADRERTSPPTSQTSHGPPETILPISPGDEAAPGTTGAGENVCPDCRGSGRLENRPCPTCGGTGVVEEGIGGG